MNQHRKVGSFLPTLRGRTQYADSAPVGLNSRAGFSRRRICENIYWWSLVISSSICWDNVKPDFFSSMDMVTSPERVYTGKWGILAKRKAKHPLVKRFTMLVYPISWVLSGTFNNMVKGLPEVWVWRSGFQSILWCPLGGRASVAWSWVHQGGG